MKLGALEKTIMNVIWSDFTDQEFAVRDIVNYLHDHNSEYAYNTILTVLTHLYEKELLYRKKVGKSCIYTVRETQDSFIKKASVHFMKQMKKDYGDIAVAHFVDALEEVDANLLTEIAKKYE